MKLDEMVDTFSSIVTPHIGTREALTAVLRKHIEPMIAEAYAAGSRDGYAFLRGTHETDYAHRIITAIVEK